MRAEISAGSSTPTPTPPLMGEGLKFCGCGTFATFAPAGSLPLEGRAWVGVLVRMEAFHVR